MAKHNVFSAKGIRPAFDMYYVPATTIEEECEEILLKNFGLPLKVVVDEEEEGQRTVRFLIVDGDEIEDNHPDVYQKMSDAGMDPDADGDVHEYLSFRLGGGQDTWIEWAGPDDKGIEHINMYINPRQDVELELLNLMEIIQDGTRNDALLAATKMLKKVCVR